MSGDDTQHAGRERARHAHQFGTLTYRGCMVMRYHGPLPSEEIRQLPIPELALRLLRGFGADLNVNNFLRGAEQAFSHNGEPDAQFLLERLADAWTWLEAHALIGPHEHQDPATWRRVTGLGREIRERDNAITELWANERLAGELHATLEQKVRPIFSMGDLETAAFAALKAVEVEVRRLAGFDDSDIGVKLMRKAFGEKGPLRDEAADAGERVALMELFAGAIGAFKNPASHRTVRFDNPVEAAEVVQLADLLLRILARLERRLADNDRE